MGKKQTDLMRFCRELKILGRLRNAALDDTRKVNVPFLI